MRRKDDGEEGDEDEDEDEDSGQREKARQMMGATRMGEAVGSQEGV